MARTRENSGHAPEEGWSTVIGNERLTALAGAVLLVLILVELLSAAILHTLMSVHVFAGIVLAGPLIVKLGSTGTRFVRYYTRVPAFVRRGPPHLALRILAPLLIATTILLVGSGIGLVLTGPTNAGPLLPLHGFSALLWLPLLVIHGLAHIQRVPRLIADDWSSSPSAEQASGRELRLGVNLGALVGGAIAAILLLPAATPWITWSQTNARIPAPLIVGTLVTVILLLITRPLKWR